MTDKKVKFDDDTLVTDFKADAEDADDEGRLKKGKHSLDSDEDDDDNDKYDVMKEDDIEGQEESTIDFDDDIQITPFNMRDEMEEGHFDKDGTYIFDKSKDIKDNWIDNIDWVRIKESERQKAQERIDAREEAQEAESTPVDKAAIFKEMLEILQPQETVAKALRRLGKSKGKPLSTAQRWKAKRQKRDGGDTGVEGSEKSDPDKKMMLHLTEISDTLVQDGMMDIYEATRERIGFMLKQVTDKEGEKFAIPDNVDDDDALDMFADNFDKKEAEKTSDGGSGAAADKDTSRNSSVTEVSGGSAAEEPEDQVQWEYKEENTDDASLFGPYTTIQMMDWKDDGTFKKGVFCRRAGSEGQFYSSNRVDFDLYI